jgi:ferric-dicitrate binding protein FerR (iron transport regulator)
VADGHPTPLEVRAFNTVVDAPSGSLVVRTYAGDSSVTLVSISGDDSLRVGKDRRALASGSAVHVAHDGTVRDATPGERAEASSWVNDTLTIADRPLKTAIDEIRSWYGTKIVVLDTTLLKRPVSASATLTSSLAAIAAVEKSGQVKFGYEGQAMVFRDAARK